MKKSEAITQAYALIRISGLTVQAVPEDIEIATAELDQQMWMWREMGREVNYNYPAPTTGNELVRSDPNEELGVFNWAIRGTISALAVALVEYFGKAVPDSLARKNRKALSVIKSATFKAVNVQYPNRMPRGSGNTFRTPYYNRFYYPSYIGRQGAQDITLDSIRDYQYDWTNFLAEGDTIDTYTIQATGGVKLVSDSRDGNVINYRVDADAQQRGEVEIEILTTNGLVESVSICFEVTVNNCGVPNG